MTEMHSLRRTDIPIWYIECWCRNFRQSQVFYFYVVNKYHNNKKSLSTPTNPDKNIMLYRKFRNPLDKAHLPTLRYKAVYRPTNIKQINSSVLYKRGLPSSHSRTKITDLINLSIVVSSKAVEEFLHISKLYMYIF